MLTRGSRTPNIHSWSFLQSQQKGTYPPLIPVLIHANTEEPWNRHKSDLCPHPPPRNCEPSAQLPGWSLKLEWLKRMWVKWAVRVRVWEIRKQSSCGSSGKHCGVLYFFLALPYGLQDLSSLTREASPCSQQWERTVLTTGSPENSISFVVVSHYSDTTVITWQQLQSTSSCPLFYVLILIYQCLVRRGKWDKILKPWKRSSKFLPRELSSSKTGQ